jgi:hypothetical protein
MGLFRRRSDPVDRITSEDLAQFGRYEFLGAEQSGVPLGSAYSLISNLNDLVYTRSPTDRAQLVAELSRHADKGEWEKVGAWKYVREFLDEAPDTRELIDGGLLAIHRMHVTNLGIHLATIDTPRYAELTGGPPPNDGFFGPPVFDSNYGPTRQYYFDQAVATAAARQITRVESAPGVKPGPIHEGAAKVWDFGFLVYRGPLVVSPDIQFEPNVVRPLIQAATGVDHALLVDQLADAVLDTKSYSYGAWSAIGGARFVEEYLDPVAVETEGYKRLLDTGLALLREGNLIGVALPLELLTPPQQARLNELSTTEP